MKWLVKLYPATWQARYGEEFTEVLSAQRLSMGLLLDVIGGAVDARLHPQVRSEARENSKGEDSMTNAMIRRCSAGGPKLSPRDQKIASMAMVVSSLVLAGVYLVLTKIYRSAPAVQALGYGSAPMIWFVYEQTAYLRKRPLFTQILVAAAGVGGLYLFMFGTCVLASKL